MHKEPAHTPGLAKQGQQWDLGEKQHQTGLFQWYKIYYFIPLNAPPRAQLGLLLPLPPFSKWEPGSLFNHNYFLFLNHFQGRPHSERTLS